MTAGDKGVAIVIDFGGYIAPAGSTATLYASPGSAPNPIGPKLTLTPVVIVADGLTGRYVTTGNDFLEGGPWQLQANVLEPSGNSFASPWGEIYINPLLSS